MSGFKPYDASSSGGGGGGGGGGVFQAEQRFVDTIVKNQTGDLLTVTASEGKTIKITSLYTLSTGTQSGISLIVNGNTLVDQKTLHDSTPTSTSSSAFGVGQLGNANFILNLGMFTEVYCTSFIVNKNNGIASENIVCTYEIGEVK